jgi:2-succinyl-5-enolpyruvyl-6-hydroxy-3-cyclohexene-1-carboxylate synthase
MTTVAATRFAAEFLGSLVGLGVTDIVVCPGSRSQALALTAAALAQRGDLRVHVRIDERAAAFLALGIAVESGVPAPVITTSGSAVANLLPAVVEAHHAHVPMMLLTADRPAAMRGTGANQVTIQPGMFGEFVSWESDVVVSEVVSQEPETSGQVVVLAATAWQNALVGPAHVNLQFVEPLSSPIDEHVLHMADQAAEQARDAARVAAADSTVGNSAGANIELTRGPLTVVVAGADAGDAAERLAFEGGWPLIAEVSSGARFGRNLIVNYREALSTPELADEIGRVIVFGHPTLSRQIPQLSQRPDVETIHVRPHDRVVLAAGSNSNGPGPNDSGPNEADVLNQWRRFDRDVSEKRAAQLAESSAAVRAPNVDTARSTNPKDQRAFVDGELAASRAEVTRELLVDAVWRATWPHDRLVFGASRLIRVADSTLPGKKITVHANRGLSGIDGNIGTGMGIALAAAPALTRVVLGDVAALHDAGSMLIPRGDVRPRVQVIVGNDGGGSIFDQLEVADSADPNAFDRVMFTSHDASFEQLAAAYGWRYVRADTMGDLERALTGAGDEPELVEVRLAR